ncbi:MAG: tetratricopeptide repeat protein, partial [Aquabacterium sp.]
LAMADALSQARGAVDRRDPAAALILYQQVLAQQGENADLLIEVARVNGFADRNADAARLYRRALAAAPQRRADILPSLAWQSLWAGWAEDAVALFTELAGVEPLRAEHLDGLGQALQAKGDQPGALAALRRAHALAPTDMRLHRRLALSLLWNGQEDQAMGELAALVSRQPGDRDLAWALANARNFAGLHRRALTDFLALQAPVHPGERADLARAWRWAGYEDRAWPLLAEPTDAESAWLRDWRVRREQVPYGYVTVERADDRDRLVSRAVVVGAGWHPAPGATLDFQWRQLRLDDAFGSPNGSQFQASWRWRLGEPQSPTGTLWPSVALRVLRFPGWQAVAPTARLQWLPRDRWRVDAEATREVVEAPRAVSNQVTVDVLSVGAEHKPDGHWLLAGSSALLRFDDGTSRVRAGARIERRVLARPRMTVGVEASAFDRFRGADSVDRGYWNPRRYAEARTYATVTHEWRPFDLYGRVGLGASREVDSSGARNSGRPHVWELGLGWDASRSVRLRLAAGGSGQGLGLSGGGVGYWRRYVNLSLNLWP